MRAAFILSFVANLVLALVSLAILPERVAVHFGAGGIPDGWAAKETNFLLMLGIHTLLFCSLYFTPSLVSKVPVKWISLPNRDYWMLPENRSRAVQTLSRFMWQMGTALFLFLLLAGLLAIRANLSNPVRLDERVLLVGLAVFLGYTVFWTLALIRAFRIPKKRG